jgi:hypothetical protein
MQEFYVSYRYISIENKAGDFLGIYQTCRDVTKKNLSQHRLATLLEVSTCSTQVADTEVFWGKMINALSYNKQDIAFALIYSLKINSQAKPGELKIDSPRVCVLEGLLGISDDHDSAKTRIDVDREHQAMLLVLAVLWTMTLLSYCTKGRHFARRTCGGCVMSRLFSRLQWRGGLSYPSNGWIESCRISDDGFELRNRI